MSARTSARSAATRKQASSPPKQSRQSETPPKRRLRSQSVELGGEEIDATKRRSGRRGARQSSVESVNSNGSTSSRQGRSKNATRAAAANPELSIVTEHREVEELEDNVDNDEEAEDNDQGSGPAQRSQSPGSFSQMSGTTAISAITNHSITELEELDSSIMAEILADLSNSTYRLMNLLAPARASTELIESTVKELMVVGSRLAKRLKHDEEKFNTDRQHYGKQAFIEVELVLRKLIDSLQETEGNFRPDAILYAANIATAVKDLLVTQKKGRTTYVDLLRLDHTFPDPFVSSFDETAEFGKSVLLEESFSMGLEIRTQNVIVNLLHLKDREDVEFVPDKILANTFFEAPAQSNATLPYFNDLFDNGQVIDIVKKATNTDDQNKRIKQRVLDIREQFRQNADAVEAGDLVDFDALEEEFPWLAFVANFVQWSRLRLDEISRSIKKQGGVDNIVKTLIEAIKSSDSQVDINYDPPATVTAPRQLLPAPDITPGTTGQDLYNKKAVHTLERLKRGIPTSSPSNHKQPATASNPMKLSSAPGPSRVASSKLSKVAGSESRQTFDDFVPDLDDGMNNEEDGDNRPSDQYLASWNARRNEKNKENRPFLEKEKPAAPKARFIDPQPNAKRHHWDYDDPSQPGPSSSRRPQQDEESEQSEDEGFEADKRIPNPGMRAKRPSPLPVRQPPPKRTRIPSQDDPGEAIARRNRARAEEVLQSSARGQTEEEEEEDDEDDNAPSFTQTRVSALAASQRAKTETIKTQKRIPWSDYDSDILLSLIEEHGCSWSYIQKHAEFSEERGEVGQVALKDRARNMKVSFLKAGVRLPANFDKIALGKKELASVRTIYPDYEDTRFY